MPPPAEVEAIIRQVAGQYKFPSPDLLVATARQESSLNPFAVGDQGQSYGVFQEHSRGRGAGIPVQSRQDVAAATQRAVNEFTAIRAKNPGVDLGTWAARAQRPADPVGYARSVNALLGQARLTASSQAPLGVQPAAPVDGGAPEWYRKLAATAAAATAAAATQTAGPQAPPARPAASSADAAAPAWYQKLAASAGAPPGGDRQTSLAPRPRAASPSASEVGAVSGGGAVFPVAGYTGKVDFHHGSREAVGGSDLFAPEGTPVLAMVPGTVQWASHDALGGHNVGILGDDGRTYYYAHFKNAPRVKAGQRVDAGVQIGDVGRSGNAANTPPHLHIGIGQGIQTGAGAQGGLGRGFDAVDYLRRTLSGAAPAHRDAPPVGAVVSPGAQGSPGGSDGAAPAWYRKLTGA